MVAAFVVVPGWWVFVDLPPLLTQLFEGRWCCRRWRGRAGDTAAAAVHPGDNTAPREDNNLSPVDEDVVLQLEDDINDDGDTGVGAGAGPAFDDDRHLRRAILGLSSKDMAAFAEFAETTRDLSGAVLELVQH